MAPAVDQVYDDDTQSSDWANERSDSPAAKRHCSEPVRALQGFKPHSIETSLSPPPSIHHQVKCPWCSKEFEAPEDGVASEYDVLKEHLALMHPQIANLSARGIPSEDIDTDIIMDGNNEINSHGTLGTSKVTTVTAPATGADATPEANDDASDSVIKTHATEALHSKLDDLKRRQAHEYIEKCLLASWNLHDVREFNINYDAATADVEKTWSNVFDKPKGTDQEEDFAPSIPTRPNPYLSTTTDKGEFLKLTPVEAFLNLLPENYETTPTAELHAVAANVAHALKTWQDEWQAIEKLKVVGQRIAKKPANPRALDPPEVFQDKQEAILYGYKYDSTIHEPKKRDPQQEPKPMFKTQDPFIQRGLRPTPAQLRKMQADVDKGNPNPDGFKTMEKYGQEYIPRFQERPLNPNQERGSSSRKRKAQSEVEGLRSTWNGNDSSTPALESDIDGQPYKRLTRSIVSKPVDVPQTQTAPPSPGPRGRGRGTRGGRGRGGTLKTSRPAKATLATKAIDSKAVEKQTANTSNDTEGSLSLSISTFPSTDNLTPDQSSFNATGSANIAPVPKPALAPATPGAPPALASLPPNLVQPGEVVDAFELNRRKLLAKSKNPRRTQAMLDHWDRFNKEGRTRNPKRTKAQIEADKLADAERKAKEPQKVPTTKTRKRKAASTDTVDEPIKKQSRTASMAAAVSIQPAPIQPAIAASTTTIAPPPPAISLQQTHLMQPSAPPRARSPQGYLAPHTSAHPAVSQPQSAARPIQPVLPGFDRTTAPHLWATPSRYYPFASQAPPYHSYGQTQFPPPPPPVNPSHRHDAAPSEIMQPGPTYPFDAIRPLQHLQNGTQMHRP